ncbi:MAG: ligase-associated DNA damage response exonuclease [Planctomycetota bacterium]
MAGLIEPDDFGLRCQPGDFWIDPWRPVHTALVTHAHADHARPGHDRYICAAACEPFLRLRIGANANITPVSWGEQLTLGDTRVSFHPAGHIRGSAQIRVEAGATGNGEVWVAAGDFKRQSDPTAEPFEVVPCDTFISEATFALPVYRWPDTATVGDDMLAWCQHNAEAGKVSVLFSYALGKAQRAMAELHQAAQRQSTELPGAVYLHGAAVPLTRAYEADSVELLPWSPASDLPNKRAESAAAARGSLVIAPPSAAGNTWLRRFGNPDNLDTAFASGWMRLRGIRRRRGYDRGFVLSDHADWPDLIRTARDTNASRILATHGYSETLARHLCTLGFDAAPLSTQYAGDDAELETAASDAEATT